LGLGEEEERGDERSERRERREGEGRSVPFLNCENSFGSDV